MLRSLRVLALLPVLAPGLAGAQDVPNPFSDPAAAGSDTGYRQIEQLARVIELVRQNYVDAEKVTYDKLVASALDCPMPPSIAALDPRLLRR